MKRVAFLLMLALCAAAVGRSQPVRPPILGIASVRIAVTDPRDFTNFYVKALGFGAGPTLCMGASMSCVAVNARQRIDVDSMPASPTGQLPHGPGMLSEIDFQTTDVAGMRSYLLAHGFEPGAIVENRPANLYFNMTDPEGHRIGFIQYLKQDSFHRPDSQVSTHLIHAGFVVHDRATEDKLYEDILGFHVYWHGGMKEGVDHWVDMQVPDGSDWLEYMLGVAPDAGPRTLGVMNHIALGVPDIHAAQQQVVKNGFLASENPKIGRDGKWQLNLYDPDDTRVELMEFKPTKQPCCAQYTGPHPAPTP